ncbi:Serine-rich coiled-coil domain-containing protein 1 [Triplophysa tibetana]|uniref:Serine-rich coiled-coil domain-containing protein 1 n=1 Tax=Triplophysa tibetana TaxID=1572043 RepID=A0A5A9NYR7_9TELE|nr:Serine-rich coiled-coil domain-containing protein 1 [Triplophysa tibetana]
MSLCLSRDDESLAGLEALPFRLMQQDCTAMKTLLLRLRRTLQESTEISPSSSLHSLPISPCSEKSLPLKLQCPSSSLLSQCCLISKEGFYEKVSFLGRIGRFGWFVGACFSSRASWSSFTALEAAACASLPPASHNGCRQHKVVGKCLLVQDPGREENLFLQQQLKKKDELILRLQAELWERDRYLRCAPIAQ